MKSCGLSCAALIFGISLAAIVPARAIHAETPEELALMPMPQHVLRGEGQLKIDGDFTIALEGFKDARIESARKRFLNTLSRET
jgi:hexosaminidase